MTIPTDTRKTDASVIAAAPEMYQALADFERLKKTGNLRVSAWSDAHDKADAALAKARRVGSTYQLRPLDKPPLDTPTPKAAYRCAGCSYDEPGGFHDPRELRWGLGFHPEGERMADPNWFCEDCSSGNEVRPASPFASRAPRPPEGASVP